MMSNNYPMYDLSPEQLDDYEEGKPLLLAFPVQPSFPIGGNRDLTDIALESLPDIEAKDIDDIRPGYVWVNVGSFRKDPPNTLTGLLGPTTSKRQVQESDLVTSVFCILVSVHNARYSRVAAQFPAGLIYFDTGVEDERAYHAPEHPERPTFRSPVNPDYFVDRDFGAPMEDDDEY